MKDAMRGKVALITGSNTGVGLETARGLAEQGATIVMTARSREKGDAAVADVKASTGNDDVELIVLDLASLESVRAAAREFLARHDRLDLLVNNAGLVLGDRRTTDDGFEATFGTNHLGHFELTRALLDVLRRSAPARVINVASDAHRISRGLDLDDLMYERRAYKGFRVYADSKLANILFTRELARRLDGTGVVVHAVHPGLVGSRFGRDGDMRGVLAFLAKLSGPFMLTPAQGAETSLHVALTEDAATSTGDYWEKKRRRRPNAAARDEEAARRLWSLSEQLLETAGV
jgi:retinol dehydrogenase-12